MHGRISIFALTTLVLAVPACASSPGGTATAPSTDGGRPLDITLPTLEGDDITLTAASDEDIFVLPFFATWCEPCRSQLIELDEVYGELASRGLQVYAINVDGPDSQAKVPGYVQRSSYAFPTLVDRQTEYYGRYNPKGDCPFYVVLDAHGEVLMSRAGYTKGDVTGSLRAYLEERLPPATPSAAPTPE